MSVKDFSLYFHEENERAKKKILYNALLEFHKSMSRDNIAEWAANNCPGILDTQIATLNNVVDQQNDKLFSNSKLSSKETYALMVTFRPSDTVNIGPSDFLQLALKVCKPGKGIRFAYYCIEQSGMEEETMGTGVHIHCLIQLNKDNQAGEPVRQAKRINNIFAKYKTTTSYYLDIKKVSVEKYGDKLAYIRGEKIDEDKKLKVEIDKIWRGNMNLQDCYEL